MAIAITSRLLLCLTLLERFHYSSIVGQISLLTELIDYQIELEAKKQSNVKTQIPSVAAILHQSYPIARFLVLINPYPLNK